MESLKKWYVIVSVLAFTFCVNVWGRTPAAWILYWGTRVVHEAPRLGSLNPPPSAENVTRPAE